MKTLHVCFFSQLAALELWVQPLKPTSRGSSVETGRVLDASSSSAGSFVSLKRLPVESLTWQQLTLKTEQTP